MVIVIPSFGVGETVCSMQRSPLRAGMRGPVGPNRLAKVGSPSAFRLPPFGPGPGAGRGGPEGEKMVFGDEGALAHGS